MNKKCWQVVAMMIATYYGAAIAGLTDGDIKVQGDKADLQGVKSLAVRCKITGADLYLKDEGDSAVTTNKVMRDVAQELKKAGLSVGDDSPTLLTIEFDTPGGTLMTYVNFMVFERATLVRDTSMERKILIWMATGYERGQVYPEPVQRLTRKLVEHWAEANEKAVNLPPEKKPNVVVVTLLPGKQFSINGQQYPHDKLLDVVKTLPGIEQAIVKVQSGWETRGDAGAVSKVLKDAGLNAKIDFKLGEGCAEEETFINEWRSVSEGKKK